MVSRSPLNSSLSFNIKSNVEQFFGTPRTLGFLFFKFFFCFVRIILMMDWAPGLIDRLALWHTEMEKEA